MPTIIKTILIAFVLSFSFTVNATGPSYIHINITPISINEKGDVLCRTRIQRNDMGAHYPMDTLYGLSILTNNTILSLHSNIIRYQDELEDGWDKYEKQLHHADTLLNSCLDPQQLSNIEQAFINGYDFTECNTKQFAKNVILPTQEFIKTKQIDITKDIQKSLDGGLGYFSKERDNNIEVLYDFGHIVLLNNVTRDEDELGVSFDYTGSCCTYIDDDGQEHYYGYDYENIVGVLFLANKHDNVSTLK